jgi:adenylate kinase family enzyme
MRHDSASPRTLILVRGNSGSGKTTVARTVRSRYGRGCALIEQDYLRRIILREHDVGASTGIAPEFIAQAAAFALSHGYHVVLEGILRADRYADSLRRLIADHDGPSHVYYLDVSLEETLRRHLSRPQTFTAADMRGWYRPRDILGIAHETVIGEESGLDETVDHILRASALMACPPVTYCPNACPDCRAEAATPPT